VSPALARIVAHGQAMLAFVDRMRERGQIAVTEIEDLLLLRLRYRMQLAADREAAQRKREQDGASR
jgi:hypothetical protein